MQGVLESKDRIIAQGQEAVEEERNKLRRQGDQFRDLLKQALEE